MWRPEPTLNFSSYLYHFYQPNSSCPKCELMFEIPSDVNFFVCPIEDCTYEVCRHCGELPHIPLRCDEVEKKVEAEGRARVEEAATAAVVRCCPKCKKGIIKSHGCNKITCACGCAFCYCCQQRVSDYTHFCQEPHCTHSSPEHKCPLWTMNLEAEETKARREAARAEAARVEAETKTQAQMSGEPKLRNSAVKVDVESILRQPNAEPTSRRNRYLRAIRGNRP